MSDILAEQELFHAIAGPDSEFLEAMPEPQAVEDDEACPTVDLFQPKLVGPALFLLVAFFA